MKIAESHTCISLPPQAQTVLDVLCSKGYEAWVVGGFIRDAFLNVPSADIDIATNARWETVRDIFTHAGAKAIETGSAHGTITVILHDISFEITTYRADGSYSDGRHPDNINFVESIEKDLARRDFTINAIAYHPKQGIVDPFGGLNDIKSRTIKTVGEPTKRFKEDALRVLRGCRFVSQTGFNLDTHTFKAMQACKHLLKHVSAERIAHELDRLVTGPFAGRALLETVDILSYVLPELVAMRGFDQKTPYHCYDVLEHTAHAVDATPQQSLTRWAALCHDMGKPGSFFTDSYGQGHFYGHASLSARMTRDIMERLKMPTDLSRNAELLVRRHDDNIDLEAKAVKKALARLDNNPNLFRALCHLKRADSLAHAPAYRSGAQFAENLEKTLDTLLQENAAFSIDHLVINGYDVMAQGIKQGPLVGEVLKAALDAIIDEQIQNERESLLRFVREWDSQTRTESYVSKSVSARA